MVARLGDIFNNSLSVAYIHTSVEAGPREVVVRLGDIFNNS